MLSTSTGPSRTTSMAPERCKARASSNTARKADATIAIVTILTATKEVDVAVAEAGAEKTEKTANTSNTPIASDMMKVKRMQEMSKPKASTRSAVIAEEDETHAAEGAAEVVETSKNATTVTTRT